MADYKEQLDKGIAIGTAVGGTVILAYAAFTVVDSLLKNKVNGITEDNVAKRSAMLGAAIGSLPALFYGGVTAAKIRKVINCVQKQQLAKERTELARTRTMLAWTRTGMALVGLGLAWVIE